MDDVTFDVVPGRMTGFVGANGAGKTTAMRIILGVLAASAGEVYWRGERLTQEVRRDFGYMPEERGLYPKMKIRDQLVFFGRLHGLDPDRAAERVDKLLGRLGLAERLYLHIQSHTAPLLRVLRARDIHFERELTE